MVIGVIPPSLFFFHGPRRYINLASQDRLHIRLAALLIEINHPKHGPMVGNSQGLHLLPGSRRYQFFDPRRPVKKTVFGMNVKVDVVRLHKQPPDNVKSLFIEFAPTNIISFNKYAVS